jgi:hypothetical protein
MSSVIFQKARQTGFFTHANDNGDIRPLEKPLVQH